MTKRHALLAGLATAVVLAGLTLVPPVNSWITAAYVAADTEPPIELPEDYDDFYLRVASVEPAVRAAEAEATTIVEVATGRRPQATIHVVEELPEHLRHVDEGLVEHVDPDFMSIGFTDRDQVYIVAPAVAVVAEDRGVPIAEVVKGLLVHELVHVVQGEWCGTDLRRLAEKVDEKHIDDTVWGVPAMSVVMMLAEGQAYHLSAQHGLPIPDSTPDDLRVIMERGAAMTGRFGHQFVREVLSAEDPWMAFLGYAEKFDPTGTPIIVYETSGQ